MVAELLQEKDLRLPATPSAVSPLTPRSLGVFMATVEVVEVRSQPSPSSSVQQTPRAAAERPALPQP